jgi:SAM-dependent methyltransferase
MKNFIKRLYGAIARGKVGSCCGASPCGSRAETVSERIGYTKEELESIPEGASMGLGCGNPVALASLKEGETVVDLGSGGGVDAFLAAKKVGTRGRVIGVDMTEEMVKKARENARRGGFENVEFTLGDIEDIPLEEGIADCVISNCVINLAEDKQKVFNEAFRVLKPGGRLMISDMVLLKDLPSRVMKSAGLYAGCIAGALKKDDYIEQMRNAGFENICVVQEDRVRLLDYIGSEETVNSIVQNMSDDEIDTISETVVSVKVSAQKSRS